MASAAVSDVAALLDRPGELRARHLQVRDAEQHPQPGHIRHLRHRERLQEGLRGLARLAVLQQQLGQRLRRARGDLRVGGGQGGPQRLLRLLVSRREPGQGHVRQRDVGGVADPESGLPGASGLVEQILLLEALGEQAGGLRGELRMPGRQRGPRGRPGARRVPALLEHHRQAHRRLGPVGLRGIGGQSAKIVAAPSRSPLSASFRAVSKGCVSTSGMQGPPG